MAWKVLRRPGNRRLRFPHGIRYVCENCDYEALRTVEVALDKGAPADTPDMMMMPVCPYCGNVLRNITAPEDED